ncbi:unnamed protein product [Rotaria sp. Silwood1]|nr:unnamed protein product [Rotaria sp. Silwood1]CAF1652483.1 unnamed protein product [Rotaria sp. Silwood1]
MVLKSNSWPFSVPPNFILPIELMLLHQYSKEDLQTLYTKQKYILHVSTYEMIILLLFNEHSSWTVERMQDETQIDIHLFLQILCNNLLKSKLITCSDINDNKLEEDLNENNIKTNYNIQIANDFKRSSNKKNIEGLYQTIDDDRKILIRTAIVRIMEQRKTLKYALLIQEVIHQLSFRFQPNQINFSNYYQIIIFILDALIKFTETSSVTSILSHPNHIINGIHVSMENYPCDINSIQKSSSLKSLTKQNQSKSNNNHDKKSKRINYNKIMRENLTLKHDIANLNQVLIEAQAYAKIACNAYT